MSDAPAHLVERAVPADAAAIAEFNRRLAWETEGKTLDPDTVAAGVAAALADPAKALYFVSRPVAPDPSAAGDAASGPAAGGVVPPAGCLMVTWEWSDWRNGAYWWIQSVYVRPESRGRGVFRGLLNAAAAAAAESGAVSLRLYAERENRLARAVYARCGFSEPGYLLLEQFPIRPASL